MLNQRIKRILNNPTRRLTMPNENESVLRMKKPRNRKTNSFLDQKQIFGLQKQDFMNKNTRKSFNLNKISSIFEDSPSKVSLNSGSKESKYKDLVNYNIRKIQLRRQRSRVESLDNLVQKCSDIQEDSKTSRVRLACQKANDSANRLKKSIEKCQEKSLELINKNTTEKSLRADAKMLRQQLGLVTEKYRKKNYKI
jgi:hypothetical protein